MNSVIAHVKWFIDESPSSLMDGRLQPMEIAFSLSVVMLGALALYGLQFLLGKTDWNNKISSLFAFLRPYLPDIVRIVTGMLLIINGVSRYLYAPNITTETFFQNIILLALVGIGTLLLLGVFTRLAALGLITLYILSLFFITPILLLEHIEYIGLGLYILFTGCGVYGIDKRLQFSALSWCSHYKHWAYPALRIATGVGLVILAFSEKLLNVNLASEFLINHPWNLFATIGVTDRMFIIFSGSIELLIGLSFVLSLAARVTAVFLVGLFATTAILLGPIEIIGHLFAIPVVLAILVYGKNPTLRPENA